MGQSEGRGEENDAPPEGELRKKKNKRKNKGNEGWDPEPVVAASGPESPSDARVAQGDKWENTQPVAAARRGPAVVWRDLAEVTRVPLLQTEEVALH